MAASPVIPRADLLGPVGELLAHPVVPLLGGDIEQPRVVAAANEPRPTQLPVQLVLVEEAGSVLDHLLAADREGRIEGGLQGGVVVVWTHEGSVRPPCKR